MAGQQSWRAELIHEIHKTGCRLDDAAAAADVAIRKYRHQRDRLMLVCRNCGASYRKIAEEFNVDVALVHRVVRVLTSGDRISTDTESTLPTAA